VSTSKQRLHLHHNTTFQFVNSFGCMSLMANKIKYQGYSRFGTDNEDVVARFWHDFNYLAPNIVIIKAVDL